jgi:hypothetical protein
VSVIVRLEPFVVIVIVRHGTMMKVIMGMNAVMCVLVCMRVLVFVGMGVRMRMHPVAVAMLVRMLVRVLVRMFVLMTRGSCVVRMVAFVAWHRDSPRCGRLKAGNGTFGRVSDRRRTDPRGLKTSITSREELEEAGNGRRPNLEYHGYISIESEASQAAREKLRVEQGRPICVLY